MMSFKNEFSHALMPSLSVSVLLCGSLTFTTTTFNTYILQHTTLNSRHFGFCQGRKIISVSRKTLMAWDRTTHQTNLHIFHTQAPTWTTVLKGKRQSHSTNQGSPSEKEQEKENRKEKKNRCFQLEYIKRKVILWETFGFK